MTSTDAFRGAPDQYRATRDAVQRTIQVLSDMGSAEAHAVCYRRLATDKSLIVVGYAFGHGENSVRYVGIIHADVPDMAPEGIDQLPAWSTRADHVLTMTRRWSEERALRGLGPLDQPTPAERDAMEAQPQEPEGV